MDFNNENYPPSVLNYNSINNIKRYVNRKQSLPINLSSNIPSHLHLTKQHSDSNVNIDCLNNQPDLSPFQAFDPDTISKLLNDKTQSHTKMKKYSENLDSIFINNMKETNSHYLQLSNDQDSISPSKITNTSCSDLEQNIKDSKGSLVRSFKDCIQKSRKESGKDWHSIMGYQHITPPPSDHNKAECYKND